MITSYYSNDIKTQINSDIDYIAFTFDSKIPKSSDNISGYHEFTRIIPTKTINSDNILLECSIPITVNCLHTTVTSKTNDKVYNLNSVSGLQIGNSVIFKYDTNNIIKDKIVNISGTTITLEKGSSNIAVNDKVTQEITYIHIIKGGSMTANTGNTIFILPFNKIKYNATILNFNIRIKT